MNTQAETKDPDEKDMKNKTQQQTSKERYTALGYKWITKTRNDKPSAVANSNNMLNSRKEDLETTNSLVKDFYICWNIILNNQQRRIQNIVKQNAYIPIILGGGLNRAIGKKGVKNYSFVSEIQEYQISKNKNSGTNQKIKKN